MSEITTTVNLLETIPETPLAGQEQFTAVQDVRSLSLEKSQNKFLDKLRKSFNTCSKIYSVFKTISSYCLWLKYVLAFVGFIIIPLGLFGFYQIIWIIFKCLTCLLRKTCEYFKKRGAENPISEVGNVPPIQPNQIMSIQRERLVNNGWRHKDSDKIFLKNWLVLNMNTRLNQNTIDRLAQQSSLTSLQVFDFLRAEKKRIRKGKSAVGELVTSH